MKKVFSMILVIMMLASMLALATSAMVGDDYHNYGEIANVERNSIRLDAVKENVYDKATPIPINHPKMKNYDTREFDVITPRENGDPIGSATAYIVYDTKYIWIYVEVTDATLNTKAENALLSGYKQDCVEIQVDWTNKGENIPDVTPYQSRLTHEGYVSARIGQKGTTLQGTAEQGSPNPVNWLQGVGTHTDKGYDCEFRVEIPDDVEIGEYISIGFSIIDYDSTGATKSNVTLSSDEKWGTTGWRPDKLGYIKFNYAPYTGDNTIYYVVAAMVAALAVGGVTVLTLKKRVASK